jgi:hypothetical protein
MEGMATDGYIKLARCLLNKPIFQNEKLLKVWIWCLMKASHKEHTQLVGLQKITLKPGQFITGRNAGAQQLKMKPSTFWDYIQWLKENQSLDIESDNQKSVITLVNWDQYQVSTVKSDSETDNKATAKQPRSDTNKNGNKEKNDKKEIIYSSDFEEFWLAYPRKEAKPTAWRQWQARMKEKIAPAEMITGSKNYANTCRGKEVVFIKLPATFLGRDKHFKDYIEGGNLFDRKPRTSQFTKPSFGKRPSEVDWDNEPDTL